MVIDGGLALAAPADIVGGQTHGRLQPVALAEAWVRLRPWVALCGRGATLRLLAAPRFDLLTVVPRAGGPVRAAAAVLGGRPGRAARGRDATGPT